MNNRRVIHDMHVFVDFEHNSNNNNNNNDDDNNNNNNNNNKGLCSANMLDKKPNFKQVFYIYNMSYV